MNGFMTLRQQLAVVRPDAMLKVKEGNRTVYAGCKANLIHDESCTRIMDHYVRYISPDEELRDKNWREKGLMSPTLPDETPTHEYSDLISTIYLVIQM